MSPSQLEAALPFDRAQRAGWNVALWMRHRDSAWLGRVLELHMAALLGDLPPAIGREPLDDLAALHRVYDIHIAAGAVKGWWKTPGKPAPAGLLLDVTARRVHYLPGVGRQRAVATRLHVGRFHDLRCCL